MEFVALGGDVDWQKYGGTFVSERLNNGDFDYWLVIRIDNMWELTGDEEGEQYHATISAVAPSQVSKDKIKRAKQSCGREIGDGLDIIDALFVYGIRAVLWGEEGSDADALKVQAESQAIAVNALFGFYMDRPQNWIGNTGWDVIGGFVGF